MGKRSDRMAVAKNMRIPGENGYYCEYGYWHSYTPNAKTIEALEEAERILNDPNAKHYSSWEELKAELEAEIADEEEADV